MKLLTTFSICIFVGLIGFPTVGTALELEKYLHVAKGSVSKHWSRIGNHK